MKDKIIELIGAYLPDEQKADTEAKIGGLVDEFQKEQIIQTKKELSKKYSVDLFEDDTDKAFANSRYIPKTKLEELNTTNETLLTKVNELEGQVSGFAEKEAEFNKQLQFNDLSLKLVENNFNPTRLDFIKPMLDTFKGDTVEEKVGAIKEQLPEFFTGGVRGVNPYSKDEKKPSLVGAELYYEQQRQKLEKRK